ncbi:MAG: DUF3108 domain-containing protein [Allorhizobium sp.]
MLRLLCLIITVAGFTAPAVSPAYSADIRYKTDYRISLGVLPVARASFVTEIASRNYTISGSFDATGLVDVFTDISAQTSVSGILRDNKLEASRYSLVYKSGKSVKTYEVRYSRGNVTGSDMQPAPGAPPENWIPVTQADLKAVLDPIGGLIVSQSEAPCPRTVPIFDGESRMDLVMSPKGTKTMKVAGVPVDTIVCSIRYVPRSGFRKGRDDIEFLRKATGMEIWFAKTNSLNVYAPVYARVPTRIGEIYVTAVAFGG